MILLGEFPAAAQDLFKIGDEAAGGSLLFGYFWRQGRDEGAGTWRTCPLRVWLRKKKYLACRARPTKLKLDFTAPF